MQEVGKEGEFKQALQNELVRLELDSHLFAERAQVLVKKAALPSHETFLLLCERIEFIEEIKISSTTLVEVPMYTRFVYVPQDCKWVDITLHIPNVGKGEAGRSRILLYFDQQPVCDCSMNQTAGGGYTSRTCKATVGCAFHGIHKVWLRACVESGNLLIPLFAATQQDGTIQPKLFGTYKIEAYR